MKVKFGLVAGAAIACAVMTGCKAPKAQVTAQPASPEPRAAVEAAPAPEKEKTAPAPAAEPAGCKCAPGTVHAEPCACGAADCKCKVRPPEPEFTIYRVKGGDTLSGICAVYGLSQKKVLELNPGMEANKLYAGKKIKLPGKVDLKPADASAASAPAAKQVKPAKKSSAAKASSSKASSYTGATKEYVVKSGDSLGKIAYSNGITVKCLKDMNGLTKNSIRIGQKLKIPAEKVATAAKSALAAKKSAAPAPATATAAEAPAPEAKPVEAAAPAAAEASAPAAPAAPAQDAAAAAPAPAAEPAAEAVAEAAPAPAVALTHTVKPGEDTVSIAILYEVSPSSIMDLNDLKNTDTLTPGQVLKLPPNAKVQQ